ncbi:sugar ABC transporter permease [Thermofilum adornatum]|uniref:sugar ABC transporter permease n=1 Tax=Thermofilum adornatum TaxID=1365176 RepID=UPI000AC94AE4|nr:sugar ABC transporter permease [Thermofilum adornatum]
MVQRNIAKYTTMAIMLLPAAIIIVVFLIAPSILTILISLTNLDYRFRWEWVGLSNYYRFLSDPNTPIFIRNTIIFVVGTLTFNVGVGLLLALLSTHIHDTIGTFFESRLVHA